MAGFFEVLRGGAWLTRERTRLVAFAVLAATLLGVAYLLATAHGLNDSLGRPLGTDFSSFYAAGTLVADGLPAGPYDLAVQHAREQSIFGAATPFFIFPYPPFFLLLAGALALMSYPLALALWQGVTLALYLLSIRAILSSSWPGIAVRRTASLKTPMSRPSTSSLPATKKDVDARHKAGHDSGEIGFAADLSPRAGRGKEWLLLALAFPAVFINLGHGQNGFLTAALFGFALATLERRPLVAGLLFGLLAYKPQLGMMIPLVLLATGQWRVIAAAGVTVAIMALATLVAFGPDVWHAFYISTAVTRTTLLEYGDISWYKMQSVFAWVRLWHGPVALAYLIQGAVTLTVAASLAWLWRSKARYALKAAALPLATLLATPFCFDYDLMLLAPVIAFLAADASAHGVPPWQKSVMAAMWIVPLVGRSVAEATLFPLAIPVMLLGFAFLLRCAMSAGATPRLWQFAPRALK